MTRRTLLQAAVLVILATAACGGPNPQSLRDSFAQQVASNKFITGFQRNGDDLTFSGPGADGGVSSWRIHIDSVVVEPNADEAQPYKGTVTSSWYSDDTSVTPSGGDSNLPIELMSNGLSQNCWALWNPETESWGWE